MSKSFNRTRYDVCNDLSMLGLRILTRLAVNITVNKIDIQRVRYHFSRDRVTMVWSLWHHQQSVVTSSAERKRASETLRRYAKIVAFIVISLQWRHYDHVGVSNHQHLGCLLNRLFGCRSKKTSKLRVTGLCAGNSPGTGEFPAQMVGYAENVSIWWRHHVLIRYVV